MQLIIFPQADNRVSVMTVAPEFVDQLEDIAAKDVPFQNETEQVWRVIDSAELPPYELRARWRWTAEGPLGIAPEEPVVVPVPVEVSRFQARAVLLQMGILQTVDQLVAASGDALLHLAWQDAQVFRHSSPSLRTLAMAEQPQGLGLTEQQYDDLFRAAATIEV